MSVVAAIGNLSLDVVAGGPPRPGGAAFYAARAFARLEADGRVVTRCAAREADVLLPPLRAFGIPVTSGTAATTTAVATVMRVATFTEGSLACAREARAKTAETSRGNQGRVGVSATADGNLFVWHCHGFVRARDHDAFTHLDLLEELRQLSLGLENVDLPHRRQVS